MIGVLGFPATITQLEEMLIAWHDLWWRSPSAGGASPFAKDGPWSLGQYEAGDYPFAFSITLLPDASGFERAELKREERRVRAALSTAEVGARDQIGRWVEMVPDAMDRAIIWHATGQAWRGHTRDWGFVEARVKSGRSLDGLRMRYRKALAELVCRVNGVPVRHAKLLRRSDTVLAHPSSAQGC